MLQNSDGSNSLGDSFLSVRIDAQLEAYRKISTDYNNIINALEQVKVEIESMKRESHENHNEVSASINKMANTVEHHGKDGTEILRKMDESLAKQSSDVSKIINNIEIYQRTLESNIKNLVNELNADKQDHNDHYVVLFNTELNTFLEKIKEEQKKIIPDAVGYKETHDLIKILHEELIKKKNKNRLRFYYVVATLFGIVAMLETLCQLGVLIIHWFPK